MLYSILAMMTIIFGSQATKEPLASFSQIEGGNSTLFTKSNETLDVTSDTTGSDEFPSYSSKDYKKSVIAFTNEDSIHTFYSSNLKQSPFHPISNKDFLISLSGLAFDVKREIFFYSEYDLGTINVASFHNNTFKTIAFNQTAVYSLYYEPTEGYLYLTHYYQYAISRLKPFYGNSSAPEIFLKLSSNDKPRGIAVDPCDSRIYWTNGNSHKPSIQRSTLEGRNIETIIDTDIMYPRGLTLYQKSKELYWVDRDLEKIERADFDGGNRVVVLRRGKSDLFGIAVSRRFIYWTEFKYKTVFKVSKVNTTDVLVVKENVQPRGIVRVAPQIDSPDKCVPRPNLRKHNSINSKIIVGYGQPNKILSCKYRSSENTVSNWFHNGNLIPQDRIKQPANNSRITESLIQFDKIRDSDEGKYSCIVSNGFVEEVFNISLEICQKCVPIIDKSQEERIIVQGTTSQVDCKYRASEEANVTWTHNGSNSLESFLHYDGGIGESVIRFPLVNWDSGGLYNCSVINALLLWPLRV